MRLRILRYLTFTFIAMFMILPINSSAQNRIEIENELPGTGDWMIPSKNRAANKEIEGYASSTSVNVGQTIYFHLNTTIAQSNPIEIFRLGYYGGQGGRLVYTTSPVAVSPQAVPSPDPVFGLMECDWVSPAGANWPVPANATSGVYLAKLKVIDNGLPLYSYVSFVVRDDNRTSDILFQRSVTTDQAYNNYPGFREEPLTSPLNGKSLYPINSFGPPLPGVPVDGTRQARKVSFRRPYSFEGSIYQTAGGTLFAYDFNLIRWLEKNRYDVTYCTDIDLHTANVVSGIIAPGRHKVFLSGGHDEYWSWEMRDNIEKARNRPSQPLNLGFFGGNDIYWQIRLEPGPPLGSEIVTGENRIIVAYKETAKSTEPLASDPYFSNSTATDNNLITNKWRENKDNNGIDGLGNPLFKYPEDEILGGMYSEEPKFMGTSNEAVIGPNCPGWINNGMNDEPLDGLIGDEADRLHVRLIEPYLDRTLYLIAESPYRSITGRIIGTSHMIYYVRTANSVKVFSAGSQQWAYGLDDWGADPMLGPSMRAQLMKGSAQKLTSNVLGCLISGQCGQ